jgi:nucleoside recognition membrane protein YjiH
LKRRPLGYALAPLVLTAMILIGVGIVSIQVVFAVRDLDAVWAVAVVSQARPAAGVAGSS